MVDQVIRARFDFSNTPGNTPNRPIEPGGAAIQQADGKLLTIKPNGTTRVTDIRDIVEQLATGPLATAFNLKADLVNGVVPIAQLPPGFGGGGPATITASQITDSSGPGRSVLTGTPAQGRSALQLGGAATRDVGVAGGVLAYDDASTSGRAVLAGTPAQGRAALQIPETSVSLRAFGADPTGATPSDGAIQRAWDAIKATGGTIVIPPGNFVFTAREVVTLPDTRAFVPGKTVTVQGSGMDATNLHWPNANGGMKFVSGHVLNCIHVADFSVTTGVPDGGEGIVYYGTDFYGGLKRKAPMSTMRRIKAAGLDTPAQQAVEPQKTINYWTRALGARGLNGVSWYDCMVWGACPNGEQALGTPQYVYNSLRRGKGICVEGMDRTPGAIPDLPDGNLPKYLFGYGLLYNVYGGQLNALDIGFYYGDVVQGVNLYGINFGYCRASVETAPDPLRGDLAQLYLTNCQSGAGTGTQVNLITQLFTLGMTNCTWFLYPGTTGLYMKHSVPFTVTGSTFQGGRVASNPSIGIDVAGADIPGGSIIGNIFRDSNVGIRLQTGVSGISVDGNHFASLDIEVSNTGDRNCIGMANIGENLTNPAVLFPPGPGNGKGSRNLSFRSVDAGGTKRDATLVADPDGNMNLLMEASKIFAVQGGISAPSVNVSGNASVGSLNASGNASVSGNHLVGGDLLVTNNQGVNGGLTVNGASKINGPVGFNGANPTGIQTISGSLSNSPAMFVEIIKVLQVLGFAQNNTTP